MDNIDENKQKQDETPIFSNIYTEDIKKKKTLSYVLLRLLLVASCFIIGIGVSTGYIYIKDVLIPKYAADNVMSDAKEQIQEQVKTQNDVVKYAINKVKPSVVSITTLTESTFLDRPTQSVGAGSGIIFYKTAIDIFIATNHHVIDSASKVGVAIGDSKPILAKLVGKDENSDLAVISVKLSDIQEQGIKDISVAKFDIDDSTEVGDYVVAIGNAVGEGITSTFGIISSISKDIVTNKHTTLDGVMQTTAAINPGNSGGALINLKGEIVGINTAKEANNIAEGMGYTISSKKAMPVIEQIMNNIRPASLGVSVTDTSNISSEIYLPGGALVVEVKEGSSAQQYGIKPGDIITSINNAPILSATSLVEEMKKYSVSDTIVLKVIRDEKVKTIEVKLIQTKMNTSF